MRNSKWTIGVITAAAVMFLAAGLYAAAAPDVIPMQTAGYEKHTKGIVQFTHKKHATDYKATCGDCHHDAQGKPLAALKDGDPVQKCVECHKIVGEIPKEAKAELKKQKLSKEDMAKKEREYHAEALHENCQGCHKDFNKKNNSKAAPTTCTTCHPKQ
jgi:hypothetical protein